MNLVIGDVDPVKKRLTREALVRVGVIGGHVPLVAPPNVPARPVEIVLGQSLVDRAGRRAAGERDAKATRPGALGDPGRRVLG